MMQTKPSSDWVVDTELKLRDHEGLYVCDPSVLPTMLSSPPALTCAALLGYAFSKILLSKNEICKPSYMFRSIAISQDSETINHHLIVP
jgi:choline dehydrogenase-like flavoprotein